MDNLMQILFNTNHELPSGWVLMVLILLAVVVPSIMRYVQSKREAEREIRNYIPETTQKQSKPKKKKSGKKKR